MSEPGHLPRSRQMKPNLHGWFLRKNDDGLLSLWTVKANRCQTEFGNVHNGAFTIAIIAVSILHAMRASVWHRRESESALRIADPASHRGVAVKLEATFVCDPRVSQ